MYIHNKKVAYVITKAEKYQALKMRGSFCGVQKPEEGLRPKKGQYFSLSLKARKKQCPYKQVVPPYSILLLLLFYLGLK